MRKIYLSLFALLSYCLGTAQTTIFSENVGSPGGTTAIASYTGWQNQGTLTYSNGGAAAAADVRSTSVSSGYTGASGAGNVFFTTTAGDRGFSIEGINASNYTNLSLQFAYRKESSSALPTLALDYWNGSAWVNVPFTFIEAPTAVVAWYLSPAISLPAAAQITGLKLRWVKSGTNSTRVDDIVLTGTLAGGTTINISPGSLSGFSSSSGTPSAEQMYTVSGSGLTSNISIAAPAGFEISTSTGTGFTNNLTVTQSGGTVSNTTIYVRMNSTTLGTNSGNVSNSSAGATTQNVAVSGNILSAEPMTQASDVVVSNVGNNSLDINWTNGNGVGRLVVIRPASATEASPADGLSYTANTAYGTTGTTTGTNNYCVFNGTAGGPVTVTGLTAGTSYTITVYEYNGTAGSFNYLSGSGTNNPQTFATTGISPNVTQVNFTGVSVPLFMASGNASRLPVVFHAKVSNLLPNTAYRYFVQGGASTDFGTTATGAGNPLLIDYTVQPATYAYTSSASMGTAGGYAKFTTDANGNFAGFFGFVNTGNARFTAGSQIYPIIALAPDAASPTSPLYRFALNQSITVLQFGTTSDANDGTFIKGGSSATAGNIVSLWRTPDGSARSNATLALARPLAMTIAEGMTVSGAAWPSSFVTGYDNTAGSWNTIIPNGYHFTGIQLIQQLSITNGTTIGCSSDIDGVWPSGANTVSPTGGVTPIDITSTDAPLNSGSCYSILPVKLSNLKAAGKAGAVILDWSNLTEENVAGYFVERSSNGRSFTTLGQLHAKNNNWNKADYSFIDAAPAGGDNFYRIKVVESSGKAIFSNVVRINTSKKGTELIVYPNPVKGSDINVQLSNLPAGKYSLKVFNMNGQEIDSRLMNHAGGSISETFSFKNLKSGVYTLQMTGAVNLQKTFVAE